MGDCSEHKITLDRLPRTITLVRADGAVDADFFEGAQDPDAVGFELVLVDQTKLPYELSFLHLDDWEEVVDAIKRLRVRGAPALGIAGAAAIALCARDFLQQTDPTRFNDAQTRKNLRSVLDAAATVVSNARPTAVNLADGVQRALEFAHQRLDAGDDLPTVAESLCAFVNQLESEDEEANRAIGRNGAALLSANSTVLTHCNAGSLATAFFGTALGVVYTAAEQGKIKRVFADETRPVGQGARLTTWELSQAGVPVTLICDDMAASVMATGVIDAVVVGADRITKNGDVANKIGTYGLAVLARYHNIPFYVAAPSSTIDSSLESGSDIPIEERDPQEVLPRSIEGVDVYNPAFDVTPAHLITKIITDLGVFSPDEIARANANAAQEEETFRADEADVWAPSPDKGRGGADAHS